MKNTEIQTPLTPDPEVLEKPQRRRFSAEYKQRILAEADTCKEPGQIGALLRREGLYASYLRMWRLQRDKILLEGLADNKRGRKRKKDPRDTRLASQEREILHLKSRLEEARLIIDIQKKIFRQRVPDRRSAKSKVQTECHKD